MFIRYLVSPCTVALMVTASTWAQPKDSYVYKQSTGELFLEGKKIASGYSGHGNGLNNPKAEAEENVGPIPRGLWTIGSAFDDKNGRGPVVLRLTFQGQKNAHSRSGFLIHGDNGKGDKSASNGCIILDRSTRERIANGTVKKLLVEE